MAKKNKSAEVDDIIVRQKVRNRTKKKKQKARVEMDSSKTGSATGAELGRAAAAAASRPTAKLHAGARKAPTFPGRSLEKDQFGRTEEDFYTFRHLGVVPPNLIRIPGTKYAVDLATPEGVAEAGVGGLRRLAVEMAKKLTRKGKGAKASKGARADTQKATERLSRAEAPPSRKTPAELREARTRAMNQRSEQLRPDSAVKLRERGGKSEVVSSSVPRGSSAGRAAAGRDYDKYGRMQDEVIDLIHGVGPAGAKWKGMSTAGRKQLFDDLTGMSYESYMKKYAAKGAPKQPKELLKSLDEFYKAAIN